MKYLSYFPLEISNHNIYNRGGESAMISSNDGFFQNVPKSQKYSPNGVSADGHIYSALLTCTLSI